MSSAVVEFWEKAVELEKAEETLRNLSHEFLLMSKKASLPLELRDVANIVHGRLNVSAFEVGKSIETLPAFSQPVKPKQPEADGQGTLF